MWNSMEPHDSLLPVSFQVILTTTFQVVRAGQASVYLINVYSKKQYLYSTQEKNQAQRVADSRSWR